jgi:hypothetical protein
MTTPPARDKVIIQGNVGVSQTAIANRQFRIAFRADLRLSIGVMKMKSFIRVAGQEIRIDIWDTDLRIGAAGRRHRGALCDTRAEVHRDRKTLSMTRGRLDAAKSSSIPSIKFH